MVKSLSKFQFQAFPHAPRPAIHDYLIEEHEWYSDDEECTLGVLFRDKLDDDWAYVILQSGPDSVFRCVAVDASFNERDVAQSKLLAELNRVSVELKELGATNVRSNIARSIRLRDPFVALSILLRSTRCIAW